MTWNRIQHETVVRLGQELEEAKADLVEVRSELARHHRDFAQISEICLKVLDPEAWPKVTTRELGDALREIRRIVG